MKADDPRALKAGPFTESFRGFIERLRAEGELVDLRQPVDIRHIATLVDQSDKALFFHDVIGYDMPVVSGLIRSRSRAILSMGCRDYAEIEAKRSAARVPRASAAHWSPRVHSACRRARAESPKARSRT